MRAWRGIHRFGDPLLGHKRCGAVAAACEIVQKNTKFPGSIDALARTIVPAAEDVAGQPGDYVENAVRESAIRTARKIATDGPIISELVRAGKVRVLAGSYDIEDGRVEFFT